MRNGLGAYGMETVRGGPYGTLWARTDSERIYIINLTSSGMSFLRKTVRCDCDFCFDALDVQYLGTGLVLISGGWELSESNYYVTKVLTFTLASFLLLTFFTISY